MIFSSSNLVWFLIMYFGENLGCPCCLGVWVLEEDHIHWVKYAFFMIWWSSYGNKMIIIYMIIWSSYDDMIMIDYPIVNCWLRVRVLEVEGIHCVEDVLWWCNDHHMTIWWSDHHIKIWWSLPCNQLPTRSMSVGGRGDQPPGLGSANICLSPWFLFNIF